MQRNRPHDKRVLVIGLGRFGSSLALELVAHGWEVLGVDSNARLVQAYAESLTHTVIADSTDDEALRQLGAQEFSRAVVAIGTHLEESILTTSLLVDMGVPDIWAKAISRRHGRILQQIGAHHVVLPEHDMGERVAHLVSGRMLDYVEIEQNFALGKTRAPREIIGRKLGETRIRSQHGITVVCIKRHGEQFTYATAETVPQKGDIVIVAGKTDDVEKFAELS
ncbi:potassium channel family protein [Marinitenerispora sediminis]|uniref:Potassium transporter n=1 Tax=Marinitenerispora sediminis TaxID=1931232 RepID=A0A368T7I7_9ACTN|nr:TrkA family potassium uptake protein [Marinitenerispora sediminis]RCV52007.1 potassium transporter [Marinitenerispora sediminis]RCV56918.1 potassium transporter [Marinitenerispora sediminis]RCV60064.1 potassium transporter [Marinitenerispora sediminis]